METQLLSHAANELSNILTIMNGSLKYIESSHPEVRCYKYWLDVRNDSSRMQEILHNLIDYNQGACLLPERTDLQKLLRGCYLSCLPLTEGTQKSLTFTSRTNGPCLMLDPERMREALINIIKNALEAISDDGWVHILLTKNASKASIQIQDNGCGLTPEQLLTIFDPFIAYRPGGVGLGLSIVKRILDAHNGSIIVTSLPNQGTTFTVSLPLCAAERTSR